MGKMLDIKRLSCLGELFIIINIEQIAFPEHFLSIMKSK
jgi:hypothetical protein